MGGGCQAGRTLSVDGKPTPYHRHVFWSALTNTCFLPSTVFPAGRGEATGLPIGLQIAGPEFGDYTTIELARLLEVECGYTFQKPPLVDTFAATDEPPPPLASPLQWLPTAAKL